MNLKWIGSVKKRITTAPPTIQTIKQNSINYINICFLKYINLKNTGGDYIE